MDTAMLERVIREKINEKLPGLDLSNVYFCVGGDKIPEGVYVYADCSKYYYISTERGKIYEYLELESEEEILWKILHPILFQIASDYEHDNRIKGVDPRRAIFAKEIELYSKFGEKFEMRKRKEIDEILKKYPYNDELFANNNYL